MANIHRIIGLTSVLFVLSACGGGSSGGGGSATKYLVGGVASGISGQNLGIVLRLNGEDPIQVSSDGEFRFTQALPAGSTYQARLAIDYVFEDQQKRCALLNSDGTVSTDSSRILNLRCVPAALRPSADFSAAGLVLNWTDIGAARYNVFAMPLGVSDVENYSAYPGAEMASNVTGPLLALQKFSLGERSFVVEAEFEDGHSFLSTRVDDFNGTPLGGIISESRLLTKESSPYRAYTEIQVAPAAVVEFAAGTEYFGGWEQYQIRVFGQLKISGTLDELVHLQNLRILGERTSENLPSAEVHIQFASVAGYPSSASLTGSYNDMSGVFSFLQILNSHFSNSYLEHWVPSTDDAVLISKNVFRKFYGLRGVYGSGTIINNVFDYDSEFGSVGMVLGTPSESTNSSLRYNSFIAANGIELFFLGKGELDAIENYWGTTDVSAIRAMINDGTTDLSLEGVVLFEPFLLAPHPDTPPAP